MTPRRWTAAQLKAAFKTYEISDPRFYSSGAAADLKRRIAEAEKAERKDKR